MSGGIFGPWEAYLGLRRTLLHILANSHPDRTNFDPINEHSSFLKIIFLWDVKIHRNLSLVVPNRPGNIKIELSVNFCVGWTHSHQNPMLF